ncbi:reduction of Rh1 [Ptiloglossa arizonensis]|uniref:reduction of Rh1 n=1 Tax=Ptiloglossa arizonensis TaxID=3350558 RepID=UPI003FA0A844
MSAEKVDRRMKFPYTFTARLVQFPYKYYYNQKNAWVFRYGLYAAILTLPVFYKIEKLSFNEENVKKWNEIHRREFSGEMIHH